MVMNAANGIQGRLRSSAVSWVTVHKPTDQCECDFDGALERLNAKRTKRDLSYHQPLTLQWLV
jgi:hypothetical protein